MNLKKSKAFHKELKKAARNFKKMASKTQSFPSEEELQKACDSGRSFWFEGRFRNSFLLDCLSFMGLLFIISFFANIPLLPSMDPLVNLLFALVILFGTACLIFALTLLIVKKNEFVVITPDSIFWRNDLSLRVLSLNSISKIELKWTENKKDHTIILRERDNYLSWIKLGRLISSDKFYTKVPEIIYRIVNIYWDKIEE